MGKEFDSFNSILDNRYSCRAFLKETVPLDLLEEIIETAQKVPSWCNAQPWQLTLVEGERLEILREKLWEAGKDLYHQPDISFPTTYEGIYKARRRECGFQLYDAVGIVKGDREASFKQTLKNYRFFEAPHIVTITTPKALGTYGVLDCGAFITAFTLAATAKGLATIPQAAPAGLAPILREYLSFEEDRDLVCVISFGYEDKKHPANQFRTLRAGFNEIVDTLEE